MTDAPPSPAQDTPPAPAPGAARPTSPAPAWELVVMISGAAVLIGSFMAFVSISEAGVDLSWNAWSNALSLVPVTTIVVLYALLAAGQLALGRYTTSTLPNRILEFTWPDLRLLFGTLATLTMIGYFARDWPGGGVDREIGMYLMTLGAIGLLAGAVMERSQGGTAASVPQQAGTRQPTQGDIAIMIAGAAILVGSLMTVFTDEGEAASAWAQGPFPLYVVPVALGAAMASQVALTTFGIARIPDRILGLEWSKIHLAFGVHAALMMLGFLVGRFYFTVLGETVPEPETEAGFWIMLLAALGLAAGAILRDRESTAGPRGGVPTPAGPPVAAPPPSAAERLDEPGDAPPPPAERLQGPPPAAATRVAESAPCPHCGAGLPPVDRLCAACGRARAG